MSTQVIKRVLLLAILCSGSALPLRNLAQEAPGISAREHALRANEALKTGHPEKAIPEFQALIEEQPGNVDAQANLGVLLYFRGDLKDAVTPLRTAVQLNPSLAKIQALLGLAEAGTGETQPAAHDLDVALHGLADPKDIKLRKQVGLKLVELDTNAGDLPAAAAVVEQLKEGAPTDPEVLYAGYRVYSDLAGESLLDLSLGAPKSAQMQQAIAHELERVRDVPGAIASFRRAIAIDPTLPGIHLELAEALRASDSQQDKAAAEGEYALALKQNPGDVHAAVRLGEIHADRNDLAGAQVFYEQALNVQPGMPEASIGLAQVESERGENDRALALLRGVVAADLSNMLAHFRLSALYRKMHMPEDAKRELAEYQKIRDLKESLRQVYSTMKLQAPGSAEDARGQEEGSSSAAGVGANSGARR